MNTLAQENIIHGNIQPAMQTGGGQSEQHLTQGLTCLDAGGGVYFFSKCPVWQNIFTSQLERTQSAVPQQIPVYICT